MKFKSRIIQNTQVPHLQKIWEATKDHFIRFSKKGCELEVYLAAGNPDTCKTRFTHMINYFKGSLNTNGIIHQHEAASTNVRTFPERIYNPANTVHSECVTERTDLQETICLHDDCILWHF